MKKSELRKIIKEEIQKLSEKNNPQNQKLIEDNFPLTDNEIIKYAKTASKGRDADINTSGLKKPDYNYYDTFATYSKRISITLKDAGQSNVTPGGTLHSTRGITLVFYITGKWDEKTDLVKYAIRCSKNTPGGMSLYEEYPIRRKGDVLAYMKDIISSNKPNSTQRGVY